MKKMVFCLVLLLVAAAAFSQTLSAPKDNSYLSKKSFSLFDPSKLKMSQSYSFGYYSGRGGSGSVGYYLNSLEYTFSSPLKVRVDLGFLHNPSALVSRNSSISKSGAFIPGVSVDWRPSPNFNFRLDVRQVPYTGYGNYNGYYNPGFWEDYH
jgi:hypothetical protein